MNKEFTISKEFTDHMGRTFKEIRTTKMTHEKMGQQNAKQVLYGPGCYVGPDGSTNLLDTVDTIWRICGELDERNLRDT